VNFEVKKTYSEELLTYMKPYFLRGFLESKIELGDNFNAPSAETILFVIP
jgi:hypothetical protein